MRVLRRRLTRADSESRRWYRAVASLCALTMAVILLSPDLPSAGAAATGAMGPLVHERHLAAAGGQPPDGFSQRQQIALSVELADGDRLSAALVRGGVSRDEAARTEALLAGASGGKLPTGTQFDIVFERQDHGVGARVLERIAARLRPDLDLVVERGATGELALRRETVATDETPVRVRGTIEAGIYRSARAEGAPVAAIQAYLQAIDAHLSLESDIAPGDTFDMVFASRRAEDGSREAGELLYAGVERAGKPRVQLLRWGRSGDMVAADAPDRRDTVSLGMPLSSGRVTSRFGMRRHPILRSARMHRGVDFAARWGAPIHAVADGAVAFAGRHGGHGQFVRLDHGGGFGTGYAHMSRIAVWPGQTVRAGQVIGYVGSSGLSTGPHLHLEAYRGGRAVDPLSLRLLAQPSVDPSQLPAYRARMARLLAIAPGVPGREIETALARR